MAAATPFHRDEALEKIDSRLRFASGDASEEVVATRAGVAKLRAACGDLVDLRAYEEVMARAKSGRCRTSERQDAAEGLFLIGEFERASQLLDGADDTDFHLDAERRALIYASTARWKAAAEEAQIVADYYAAYPDRDHVEAETESWQRASAELARRAGSRTGEDASSSRDEKVEVTLAGKLWWRVVAGLGGELRGPVWALSELNPETANAEESVLAAQVSALAGDDDEAGRWLRVAESRVSEDAADAEAFLRDVDLHPRDPRFRDASNRRANPRHLAILSGVLALRRGDDATAAEALASARADRRIDLPMVLEALATKGAFDWPDEPQMIEPRVEENRDAIEAALSGDVEPLASLIRGDMSRLELPLALFAARAERGKDAMLSRYRWGRYDICPRCSFSRLLVVQAAMRDLGKALGDEARAAFWQDAFDRTLEVYRDDERARIVLDLE